MFLELMGLLGFTGVYTHICVCTSICILVIGAHSLCVCVCVLGVGKFGQSTLDLFIILKDLGQLGWPRSFWALGKCLCLTNI